jgi:membrane-associated phospholipid phosphatase
MFPRIFSINTLSMRRTTLHVCNESVLTAGQSFDARSNSFPSMHTSVATLTALHLAPIFGPWVFLFPLLIGLSCVFTKQHYLIDIPTGALLGWLVFFLFRLLYHPVRS